jgi:hypothetical protein
MSLTIDAVSTIELSELRQEGRQQSGTGLALYIIQRLTKSRINSKKRGKRNEDEISSDGDGVDFGRNVRPEFDR